MVENSDTRLMNEETFKKITGGDECSMQAKYKGGIDQVFAGRMTFYLNDPPNWEASSDAQSIRRRILNLPILAQHLPKENTLARNKLISEGHEHYLVEPREGFKVSAANLKPSRRATE